MKDRSHNPGFSLTEVLLAVGTLAIGMLFIAGTFLAGVYFTTVSTERTIAAIAADEAFAKIKLYDPDFAGLLFDSQRPLEMIRLKSGAFFPPDEFAYPSADAVTDKQYYWSALCRRLDVDPNSRLVQVTVFVSRKIAAHTRYRNPADPCNPAVAIDYPMPVRIGVSGAVGSNVLNIRNIENISWINDGYTIVSNQSGQIYRVVERDAAQPNRIILDRVWGVGGASVWVIPPPFDSGRYPCIAVYPTEMRF